MIDMQVKNAKKEIQNITMSLSMTTEFEKKESFKVSHLIIASTTPVYTSTSLLNLIKADGKKLITNLIAQKEF